MEEENLKRLMVGLRVLDLSLARMGPQLAWAKPIANKVLDAYAKVASSGPEKSAHTIPSTWGMGRSLSWLGREIDRLLSGLDSGNGVLLSPASEIIATLSLFTELDLPIGYWFTALFYRAVEHYTSLTHLTPNTPIPRCNYPQEKDRFNQQKPISDRTYRCAFTYVQITKKLKQSSDNSKEETLHSPLPFTLSRFERRKIALRPLLLMDTSREAALRVLHHEVQEAVNEFVTLPSSVYMKHRVITEGSNVALIELTPSDERMDNVFQPSSTFSVCPTIRDEWFMDVLQQMGALGFRFEATEDRRILDIIRELVIAIQLYSKFNLDRNHCGLWFRKQLQAAKEFYSFYCEKKF